MLISIRHSSPLRASPSLLPVLAVGACFHPADAVQNELESDGSSSTDAYAETGIGPANTGADTSAVNGSTTESMSSEDTAASDTGSLPLCGNALVEPGESCDAGAESATCDVDCSEVTCGDLHVNAAAKEECEATELAGGTCEGLGFDGGLLSCGDACKYDTTSCGYLPDAPEPTLSFSQIKRFDFTWPAVAGAEYYQLLESPAPGEPFVQLGGDIMSLSASLEMPLHLRNEASYSLRACNALGCTESAPVDVAGSLVEAVGYLKASNPDSNDVFGYSVALSADGSTLAVGAYEEDSAATGVGGNQADDSSTEAGAVYVLARNPMGQWSQQAYVKASNTGAFDRFGYSVALSDDGSTLAVGAYREDSNATGIGGNQADNSASHSGAAYVLARNPMGQWSQQAYIKASNTGEDDDFGANVALSGDGDTLAVGAPGESSNGTGVGANQANDLAIDAGAVYVFARNAADQWLQQAYIKASNTDADDRFGTRVALSNDGSSLAVSATGEDSSVTGVGGNQTDDSAANAGAAYVFVRNGVAQWSQQAYIKASNTDPGDVFGASLALSGNGDTLAVGAYLEDSDATDIDGSQADDSALDSGAIYVLVRDAMGLWSHQAYVKASNTGAGDHFGARVAIADDGNTLAVGAQDERSSATGVGGNELDDSAPSAGAVFVLARDPMDQWSQWSYVKASNAGSSDFFGISLALSGDGHVLAVGAHQEDSAAPGVGGNQADDSAPNAGAVYLY